MQAQTTFHGSDIDEVLGPATVEVIPTRHFKDRFIERARWWLPEVDPSFGFSVTGLLLQSREDGIFFLDIRGVGRLVLRRRRSKFIGITILPRRQLSLQRV